MIKVEFNISYNKNDNKIYINCNSIIEVQVLLYEWNTTTDESNFIMEFETSKFENNTFWYKIDTNLYEFNGIKIEVKQKEKIIKTEFIRFRTRYGELIKKQALKVLSNGIGDALTSTSIIRKISQLYNQKVTIFTYIPEIFINNPYIENVIEITKNTLIDTDEFEVYNVSNWDNINYAMCDLRQINAWLCGIFLTNDELHMDFFPNKYVNIPNLPEKYICINPSITYTDRTWNLENWQKFINLIQKHIPVIAIGKLLTLDNKCLKTFHPIQISNGLNLSNETSLSQAYHIIKNSVTFVTMSTGLHLLALCSDVHITELASPWETKHFRIRNGIQDYNLDYIRGSCNINCTSNLKCTINEHSNHISPLHVHHNTIFSEKSKEKYHNRWWVKNECYLNKSTYECHPAPEQVYESILNKISNLK